jgi:hypothetical protein
MGNSSIGWGGPAENPDLYSLRQDRFFYRNLFDLGIERLGENFTLLKNDEFDFDDPYNLHQYCFTQLHLLGDPGLRVWSEEPDILSVSHPSSAPVGEPVAFPVQVLCEGSPVDGATVCLWKNGDVYEVAETLGGTVDFGFTASTEGSLYVTVCHRNCIPYEGGAIVDTTASVIPGNRASGRPALTGIFPNPLTHTTEIAYFIPWATRASRVTLSIYNCMGQCVRTLVDEEATPGSHRITWRRTDDTGADVASGVYYCELIWKGARDSRRIVLVK